jgi:hypothetical protein
MTISDRDIFKVLKFTTSQIPNIINAIAQYTKIAGLIVKLSDKNIAAGMAYGKKYNVIRNVYSGLLSLGKCLTLPLMIINKTQHIAKINASRLGYIAYKISGIRMDK